METKKFSAWDMMKPVKLGTRKLGTRGEYTLWVDMSHDEPNNVILGGGLWTSDENTHIACVTVSVDRATDIDSGVTESTEATFIRAQGKLIGDASKKIKEFEA